MRSTQGEIEVFLCPDEPVPKPPVVYHSPTNQATTSTSTGKTRTSSQFPVSNLSHYSTSLLANSGDIKNEPQLLSPGHIKRESNLTPPSSSAGMRDALLGELNEFNFVPRKVYNLQSEDQNQPLGMYTHYLLEIILFLITVDRRNHKFRVRIHLKKCIRPHLLKPTIY